MPINPRRKAKDHVSTEELIKHVETVRAKSTEIIKKMRALRQKMNDIAEEYEARDENRK
jgi:hypothetical protein